MVHAIVTFYSVIIYCLIVNNCQAVNFSYSSRTVLQLTEPHKLWIRFQEKLQILFHPLFGPPVALISSRLTTRYGASFKNMFIKLSYATLTISKQRLVEEWNRFDQGIVDRAINEWRDRLRACIRANGGHFEHQL